MKQRLFVFATKIDTGWVYQCPACNTISVIDDDVDLVSQEECDDTLYSIIYMTKTMITIEDI